MPELVFKGKEFVYNHHLTVPYRPLVPHPDKSVGRGSLDDNLILHGDNLHALKALLPRYAGKVDCVFIDPPYNTGNENWSYNDNVNSPMMREWLSSNPVNAEDMLRHDKWCCMMWPRLKLLYELLAPRGSIWVTLDNSEVHAMRCLLDEIFGRDNAVATIAWKARESVQNDTDISTNNVNFILGYARERRADNRRLKDRNAGTWFNEPGFVFLPKDIDISRYGNPDGDPRGAWKADPFDAPNVRENLTYAIENPNTGEQYWPPKGRCWRTEKPNLLKLLEDGRIVFGKDGKSRPQLKVFLDEKKDFGEIETTWWDGPATTTDAIKYLNRILPEHDFDNPKPVELLVKLIRHTTRAGGLILDSFAGSGTTAEAVLRLNQSEGNRDPRHFVLVECEDYADTLTAERVRRVIHGYPYQGTQRETLLEKKLTWTEVKRGNALVQEASDLKRTFEGSYDEVKIGVEAGVLTVTGIRKVKETAPGLGGSFTFCTLGEPLDLDTLLAGESLPPWDALAAVQFHTATGESLPGAVGPHAEGTLDEWYVGESREYHVWMIYRPDTGFLKSRDAALTLDLAEQIAAAKPGKRHLVFAPARFAPNKALLPLGVEYAPLPFSLYRVERG